MDNGKKPIEKHKMTWYGTEYPEAHFVCPTCGRWVGGYTITGGGENDWGYEKNKFCRECGQKIDWSEYK